MSVKKLVRSISRSAYAIFDEEGFEWVKKDSVSSDDPHLEESFQELGGADGIRETYSYTHGGTLYRRAIDMWLEMRETLREIGKKERAEKEAMKRAKERERRSSRTVEKVIVQPGPRYLPYHPFQYEN